MYTFRLICISNNLLWLCISNMMGNCVSASRNEGLQAELVAAHKDSEFVRQKLKHLQEDVQQYRQKNAEMVEELQKKTGDFTLLNFNLII